MSKHGTESRINLGFVGVANMGTYNLKGFIAREDVRVAAVCDVDRQHLAKAKALVDEHYGNAACRTFADFRKLDSWDGIDAVVISTPDHWHALQAVHAAVCGKDVYLEKPLTLTIGEGRDVCTAFAATGRVLQTGTQQRSSPEFHRACELIRNGYLGELHRVDVGLPPNNRVCEATWSPMPVPEQLDYDFWLGPAPWAEYHEQRCHYEFRFILDYSGGQVTNFGAHHLDIVQWALGMDESGPIRAWGAGEWPENGLFTTATRVDFGLAYASGVEVRCQTGESRLTFVGSKGTLSVKRGELVTDPPTIAEAKLTDGDVRLYNSESHHGNWIDCIRNRKSTVCPPEVGHRSATCCHLANIAMRLGREVTWDPVTESFLNDDEANARIRRPMREPWAGQFEQWMADAVNS